MKALVRYLKAHKTFLIIALLVIAGGMYFTRGEKESPFDIVLLKRVDILQKVSVTGRVESDTSVELAFEKGGRVVSPPSSVGTHVKKGDILVRLDSSEPLSLRAQAKANLDYETANLTQLHKGARAEEIAVSQAKVDSAEVTANDALLGVVDEMRGAYAIADDAVRNDTDILWRNPRTQNPELIISVNSQKLSTDLPPMRVLLEGELQKLEKTAGQDGKNILLIDQLGSTEQSLSIIKNYLDNLAFAVNALTSSSVLSQTTIDTYKANVTSARSSVETTLTALMDADKDVRSAKSALHVAQNELTLKISGATAETIAAQEAKVAGVRALVENYDAQIAKTMLLAPFTGVVTRQDAKLGETVAANSMVVSLVSDGKWKIVANIPEADVAKVTLGNPATITLDAYGSDVLFHATVVLIDPAETVIEGVSTYKITLYFTEADERIRSGMTANIEIITDHRAGVLAIPSRSVTTRDSVKYVRVLEGTVATEKTVELGLRGSDGMVEILRGLTEGERVITFERTE